MTIIIEVLPNRFVGGPMTLTGYGLTSNKSLAICFGELKEAVDWMAKNGREGCPIDYETGKVVLK